MPNRFRAALPYVLAAVIAAALPTEGASLRGSRSSLLRQQRAAALNDYTHLRTRSQVKKFVSAGLLVPVSGGGPVRLKGVSHPYARAEMRSFLATLGADYRSACGEPLVVTSLVRPRNEQPRNASPLSVHPTGMAADLRLPAKSRCRNWLDTRLLALERQGVLEATKESKPPHYHVALFPKAWKQAAASPKVPAAARSYKVRRGDTLWDIARRVGTSVAVLKRVNALSGSQLRPGQVLRLP